MRIRRLAIVLLAAIAGQASTAQPAPAEEREFYRDIRPNHWFWNGADPLIVDQVLARIAAAQGERAKPQYHDGIATYGPGNWTFEFEQVGDALTGRALSEEAIDNKFAAAAFHDRAAAYYAIAKFPHFDTDADQQRAYGKNLEAIAESGRLRGRPVEPIASRFEGKAVDGLLMMPPAAKGPVPVVIASNGIDVLKGEFFALAKKLTDQGYAFFAFDMPGTGSHSHLKLTPDYHKLTEHFMGVLAADRRVDGQRIALIGVSFGGNAAVKLAMLAPPGLKAVVNMCGPVNGVFMLPASRAESVDPMYIDAIFDRMEIPDRSLPLLVEAMRGYSLVKQGILGEGRTTAVPILSINARGDYVAPEADMELVTSSSTDGRLLYSGEGDHCPQDRFAITREIADWLRPRL